VNLASDFGVTPLRAAATSGYAPVVEVLLKAGADPNVRGKDGYTALYFAQLRDHLEVVRLLREAGGKE